MQNQLPSKKTKIICTIGPASNELETLTQMIHNGMNIARINFAHGDLDAHRQTIANVRAAADAMDARVAIFGDLPGPKMRIGELAEEPIELERGQSFILQTDECVGNRERVSLDFEGLPDAVVPGDPIFVNDGYIQLKVERVQGVEIHCTVQAGGELRSHKGVNFPGIDLGISAFTDQDRDLLAFAAEQKLDAVSQSFVLGPEDIAAVRQAAAELDYDPFIIAKIERADALARIEEILDAADGVMVARGDLGVEIPIEEIPAVQKHLIERCNLAAKPVITATQMLESMTDNRRPTRAEVTDVANAILDGSDCVMLSGETAIGDYPVETVDTMARIAESTEATMKGHGVAYLLRREENEGRLSRDNLISTTVFAAARALKPVIIVTPADSGETARRLARFRLPMWIVAPSQYHALCQCLQFSSGIYPVHIPSPHSLSLPEKRSQFAIEWLQSRGIDRGLVLMVERVDTIRPKDTNRIDVIDLG